jgi:hypothetical protein
MHWVAPSEKDAANTTLEDRLWAAADQLRANSGLNAAQYSAPALGLIFLRFAEVRFAARRAQLENPPSPSGRGAGGEGPKRRSGSRVDEPTAYNAEGVLYLTPNARFDYLLALPEGRNVGKAANEAMRDIEKHNPQLAGVLPKTYEIFNSTLLKELLKKISEIPASLDYDAFGRIYEYFLGAFARTEGQKGGEFYTPSGIVRLIVEILEPFHGRILDPACGSGGMFVSSARFVAEHKKNPAAELSIHGQEKVAATVSLCRMNLAMHGLEGDIKEAITYYDDQHKSVPPPLPLGEGPALERRVQLNRTRADYLEKFQALIDSYNSGSRNIEEIFRELLALSNVLTEEQTRHVREHMSEEELTIFDILTRPSPELTTEERDEVKKVAHLLLERLNALLVLDWRQRASTRAQVRLQIEDTLDQGLPRAYSKELYEQKCTVLFEHMYESYMGDGNSVYTQNG